MLVFAVASRVSPYRMYGSWSMSQVFDCGNLDILPKGAAIRWLFTVWFVARSNWKGSELELERLSHLRLQMMILNLPEAGNGACEASRKALVLHSFQRILNFTSRNPSENRRRRSCRGPRRCWWRRKIRFGSRLEANKHRDRIIHQHWEKRGA